MTTLAEQYAHFCKLNEKTKKLEFDENEPVYVVSNKWLIKFKSGEPSTVRFREFPVPIDNDHLFQNNQLKPFSKLKINKDYVYVNKAAWDYIYEIFGCPRIIKLNIYKNPKTGQLIPNPDAKIFQVWYNSQVQSFSIISVKTIRELKELACEHFKINPDKSRLRNFMYYRIRDVFNDNQIIEDLCSGQDLLLEIGRAHV